MPIKAGFTHPGLFRRRSTRRDCRPVELRPMVSPLPKPGAQPRNAAIPLAPASSRVVSDRTPPGNRFLQSLPETKASRNEIGQHHEQAKFCCLGVQAGDENPVMERQRKVSQRRVADEGAQIRISSASFHPVLILPLLTAILRKGKAPTSVVTETREGRCVTEGHRDSNPSVRLGLALLRAI